MKEELLEKYFLDGLSEEEQVNFEKLLNEDEAFREKFAFEKSVQKVARSTRRDTLMEKLKEVESQRTPEISQEKGSSFMTWKVFGIAASVVIMLGLAWFIFGQGTTSNEDLFATNYDTYPNTVYNITRGDTTTENPEKTAFIFYEKGQYDEAIKAFENLRKDTNATYVNFYLAQSHLAQGEEDKALKLFKDNAQNGTAFKAESLWYQSLILIKKGKEEKAKTILQVLIDLGTFKKGESQELLKALQ